MSLRNPRLLTLWVLLALLLAGCGPDLDQVRLCQRVVAAFEPEPDRLGSLASEASARDADTVIVRYRLPAGPNAPLGIEHRIACRFGGHGFDPNRLDLIAVTTDRTGTLTPIAFTMLRVWLGLPGPLLGEEASAAQPSAPAAPVPAALYALQTVVNALALCCVYGLLASGYSLVYGIIGRINLAFGEITMLGGIQTVIGATLITLVGAGLSPPLLALLLVVVMALTSGFGWLLAQGVFRPLAAAGTQAPLIAALGVSIALQESVRLLQGARDRWLAPVLAEPHWLAGSDGFAVFVSTAQLAIVGLTLVIYFGLWRLITASRFGRAHRATADDPGMAALLGIDVDRTVAITFMVGAAAAAAAGAILTLYYGGANFYMGWLIGFKALTAAIVGGIGSLPGAMAGGVLIGLFETVWSAYFEIAYKDLAVFGVLALCLLLRPQGLLGFLGRQDSPGRF